MNRLFRHSGRINKNELLVITLILFLLELILLLMLESDSIELKICTTIVIIFYVIQCSKRFHDLNTWGIIGFIWFILPLANILFFIKLYFLNGTNGVNKYGEPSNIKLRSMFNINQKSKNQKDMINKIPEDNITENSVSNAKSDLIADDTIDVVEDDITTTYEYNLEYADIVKGTNINIINNTIIYSWLKNDGDWVDKNKPLFVIQYNYDNSFSPKTSLVIANRSGFLEIVKNEKNCFCNGDIICKLHPKDVYINENSPTKESFSFFFDKFTYNDFSQSFFDKSFHIMEWNKKDGDFVNHGDLILIMSEGSHSFDKGNQYSHFAEKSGFLDVVKINVNYLNQNDLVYKIHDNDEKRITRKFTNIADITLDDFTNKKIIKWKRVGKNDGFSTGVTSISNDKKINFTFTFNNFEDQDYIVFQFISKEIMLSNGDMISFLFIDGKIINFKVNHTSYRASHPYEEKLFENKVQITLDELLYFEKVEFVKWKIIQKKQNREIIGGESGIENYQSHENLIIVIQKLSKEYRELVTKEIENHKPLLERELSISYPDSQKVEECHVYLMIDKVNFFHKIGISNKPFWREKTLQSEKPTIELLASKKFINRKIASSFEKALHETYSNKRIRGEWFKLANDEVQEILETLND